MRRYDVDVTGTDRRRGRRIFRTGTTRACPECGLFVSRQRTGDGDDHGGIVDFVPIGIELYGRVTYDPIVDDLLAFHLPFLCCVVGVFFWRIAPQKFRSHTGKVRQDAIVVACGDTDHGAGVVALDLDVDLFVLIGRRIENGIRKGRTRAKRRDQKGKEKKTAIAARLPPHLTRLHV